MLSPTDAALAFAALPCEVAFVRGNHEDWSWPDFQDAWFATGRPLHALHGSGVAFGPLVVIGFPCWMGFDGHYAKCRPLDDYRYDAWLTRLMRATGPAGRALWLMHEPPTLDLGDEWAVETEWGDAIRAFQPRVVVSGHDHKLTPGIGA